MIEKLMVALRDGRKLIGILRSWDQFGMSKPSMPWPSSSFSIDDDRHGLGSVCSY